MPAFGERWQVEAAQHDRVLTDRRVGQETLHHPGVVGDVVAADTDIPAGAFFFRAEGEVEAHHAGDAELRSQRCGQVEARGAERQGCTQRAGELDVAV